MSIPNKSKTKYDSCSICSPGARLDDTNQSGDTALALACEGGHLEITEQLLDHGADVNKGNRKPLAIATERGHNTLVTILEYKGNHPKVWPSLFDVGPT